MHPRDFQNYGPVRRRGRNSRGLGDMATPQRFESNPYDTMQLHTVSRRTPPRKSSSAWWLVPMLLIIVALAGALGGLTYLDQRYAGKIYPNVSVQGVDLTEMTAPEAEKVLQKRWERFLAAPVRFQYAGRTWEPRAEELGLRVNFQAQAAEAMQVGRGNGLIRDLQEVATIWQEGLDLPLHVTVDAAQVQRYVQSVAGEFEQPAREASLTIEPEKGAAAATESAEGRMLLLDETVADAIAGLHMLEPQVVPIRTQKLEPTLSTGDIAEAKRTVDAMLQSPLLLQFKEQTFPLSQTQIADMIAVSRVDSAQGRPTLNAQLDQTKLKKWLTRLADTIGRDSVEPRVAWNGGNLQIVQEGRSAYRLNIDSAVEQINNAIMRAERTLQLPVDEVQPGATPENLASLGIKELVATGRSDFTGSAQYRIANIKVGVDKMNGILVPPGGEFSFNENVGAIDAANGFVEGYAIVGNRTQLEPGGGICQVSTTLFRAAFYAGLPFTDWTPHRFRISWYEKYDTIGMDATIFTGGGPDLRFENDTGNWILIEGITDVPRAMVTFNIYGTKVPGREVERTAPKIANETPAPTQPVYVDDPAQPAGSFKQTDMARGGLDIEIWRIVKQDGAELRRSRFLTQFQPWPNIFVKNPKTPLPPGGKLGSS